MNHMWVLVTKEAGQLNMALLEKPPTGPCQEIARFFRISDKTRFIVMGRDIYKGEVDEQALESQLASFLNMGRRLA